MNRELGNPSTSQDWFNTYAAAGRLTGIAFSGPGGGGHGGGGGASEGQGFTYGAGGGANAGKLTSITDPSGSTTRNHDTQGRIAGETRTIGGLGFDIDYGYDDEDLLTLVTYPSGREVRYVRDAAGQVTAVQQRPDSVSAWTDVATGIDYLPFGDIDSMTRGNGVTYNATYDTSYRLTGQTDTSGTTLRDILYGYSLRDNLTSAADLLDPSQDVTYSYDPRQMLDGATGPWGAHGYAYDAVGNRSAFSLTPPGGTASTDTYTYEPASNGLDVIDNPATGSRSYSYDAAGNTVAETRTQGGTENWGYTYNDFGRLASVDLNGVWQADYLYNALGQQVSRDVGGVVTLSVHDLSGNRIAEHDATGAVIREYIWLDGRPLAVVEGGQTYQLHWDHILRPVMATGATGAVVWAASYLPFGGIDQVYVDTGALEQNLRFPGQWFQAETGLHQNGMRDYDPTTGRYLQADPLGLVDGPSVYGYAGQGPVRFMDPRGLFTIQNAIDSLKKKDGRRRGVYTPEQIFKEWLELERGNQKWLDQLRPCPCSKDGASPDFWQDPKYWPNGVPYHDGGIYDLRQRPTRGGHGTQCVYDVNGNLITMPPGAGSADYVAFTGVNADALDHYAHDVDPYNLAVQLGKVHDYYEVRPVK